MSQAFVSLATNDQYGKGAYVLGKSLRNSNTTKQLVLLLTEGVSEAQRTLLKEVWDKLVDINQVRQTSD